MHCWRKTARSIARLEPPETRRDLGQLRRARWRTPTSGWRAPGAMVGHLNAVMNSPELREAYNANLPKVTQYYTELGAEPRAVREIQGARAPAPEFAAPDPGAAQNRSRTRLRDFRLGGAELPRTKSSALARSGGTCPRCRREFSDNLLDATNAFALFVDDEAELAGIPGGRARGRARRRGEGRQARLEIHAARAVLRAGHAICRPPRAARTDVPRLRHARQRIRQARAGTTRR